MIPFKRNWAIVFSEVHFLKAIFLSKSGPLPLKKFTEAKYERKKWIEWRITIEINFRTKSGSRTFSADFIQILNGPTFCAKIYLNCYPPFNPLFEPISIHTEILWEHLATPKNILTAFYHFLQYFLDHSIHFLRTALSNRSFASSRSSSISKTWKRANLK